MPSNKAGPAMTPFDLETFLPYLLSRAAGRTSRAFARSYGDTHGIGVAEWRVLAHLARAGQASVREIHARAEMDKSRISRAAARLQAAGHVTKTADPADRRLICLALTPQGRDLLDRLLPEAARFQADLQAALGTQAAGLQAGLAALIAATDPADPPPDGEGSDP